MKINMQGRRNCGIVINNMLNHIPYTESKLRKALEWNRDDAAYKAPEETIQWERTQHTLMEYMPNPEEEWQFKVLSIFTTVPIEELKLNFKKDKEYVSNNNGR